MNTYASANILSTLWVVVVLLASARESYVSSAAIEIVYIDEAARNAATLATSAACCGTGVGEAETARRDLCSLSVEEYMR